MKIIVPNGLFVLTPAALFLSWKAQNAEFDAAFYMVQAVEILAGGVNLALLGLSMRDGLRMKDRFKQIKAFVAQNSRRLSKNSFSDSRE